MFTFPLLLEELTVETLEELTAEERPLFVFEPTELLRILSLERDELRPVTKLL